jgi:hypothetical protein
MRPLLGLVGKVVRQRLASLWKVEPFRIDVAVDEGEPVYYLDGKPPPPELVALTLQDEQLLQRKAKYQSN